MFFFFLDVLLAHIRFIVIFALTEAANPFIFEKHTMAKVPLVSSNFRSSSAYCKSHNLYDMQEPAVHLNVLF